MINFTNKEDAKLKAIKFLEELNELEKKYNMSINTDESIYLSFKNKEKETEYLDWGWDSIEVGWDGYGGPLQVVENKFDL